MKNLKLALVILVSFALGIAISRGVFNKGKADERKEENHKEEGHHEEDDSLSLNKKSQELIDLKTKTAQLDVFKKNIAVVGQIAQDAQASLHIVSPVIGTIAEAKAQIGSVVQKDELLCVVSKVNGEASLHEVKAPIAGTVIGAFTSCRDASPFTFDTTQSSSSFCTTEPIWAFASAIVPITGETTCSDACASCAIWPTTAIFFLNTSNCTVFVFKSISSWDFLFKERLASSSCRPSSL